MPSEASGGVKIRLEGAHLRVDARPARLVSLLKGGDGTAHVTAQPTSGEPRSEPLPGGARQATFQVRDDITVEATAAANFVAVAEESGRCLVIAYGGEVTVVPGGSDRFALGAHEALLIGGPSGGPTVIPAGDLDEASHPELSALIDDAADAVLAPPATTPSAEATEEPAATPTTAVPPPTAAPAPTKAAPPAAKAAKAASKSPGGGSGQRRKKGKKGRPQPAKSAAKKVGAAAGPGGAAGASKGAAKAPAKAAGGGKEPPAKKPPQGGGGGGGGGGGDDDDSYEDTPRDKRFLIGAVLVALLVAVGVVLLLSNAGDDGTELTADTTTTTEEEPKETTTTSEPEASTSTAPPATTTTTVRATTTTARATTTTAKPAVDEVGIAPKSCVQNGNSITYTAAVTNRESFAIDVTINISFRASDGAEVAKATASVTRLAPGRTADVSATGTSSRNLAANDGQCHVTGFEATAA